MYKDNYFSTYSSFYIRKVDFFDENSMKLISGFRYHFAKVALTAAVKTHEKGTQAAGLHHFSCSSFVCSRLPVPVAALWFREAWKPSSGMCWAVPRQVAVMNSYYFLKTRRYGASNRLRALPGQTFPDGSPVPTQLNIQADRKVRDRCPIGTVFCTPSLEVRGGTGAGAGMAPFMSAVGGIFPMDVPGDPLQPDADMVRSFDEFKRQSLFSAGEAEVGEEEVLQQEEIPGAGTLLGMIRTGEKWARPTVATDGFSVDSRSWEMVMTFVHNHDNLLLTGPSGSGKTELVMLACSRLGLQCRKYNMGTIGDPMSALLGVHRIREGRSVFEPAQFLEDIQKPGVVLLDEINRAPVNALNYLMSCLDGSRQMRNDYVSPVQIVPVHPECTFVATANIGVEFVGTNVIDPALNSRFFRLQMDYPSVSDEASVLVARYGIGLTDAMNISKVAKDIRDSYRKGDLSATVTVRQSLMAAKMVSCGYTALEALNLIFLPYFEGTPTEGEMGIVNKMLCSR